MKINDLEIHLVAVGQTDSATPLHALLVRVTTATGVEGWGESGLGWRVGELAARREALLAVLEGRSIYDIEELHTLEALAPPPLRSAVEMAVWDVLGRVLRQPLCNLLGGYYRRRVPISIRLGGHRAALTAQIARELAEQGFHSQTIVATGKPEEDLKTLTAIREMVGDRLELRFDGQGRYDLETARDLSTGMEPHDLQFFLDPLATRELHPVASLGRQTSVPLAVWRTIHGPADALTAVRCNAAAFLMVDLEQVGGIGPARACAAVAAAGGMIPLLGGRPSVGIATAAMLHLAAATAAFSTSNELASRQLRHTVLTDPLEITDGMISVPQSPGLGVTVDRAKVEKHQASDYR
jgi:L-alanine-DL-glutamate epimerase-like enolase superfamily enzyme